jgi:hypothetical protein
MRRIDPNNLAVLTRRLGTARPEPVIVTDHGGGPDNGRKSEVEQYRAVVAGIAVTS